MYPSPINSRRGTPSQPKGLWRSLLALVCILGMFASFLQPGFARAPSKAASAAFLQSHSVKGDKPCQRAVPGAVGTSCSVGTLAVLEIKPSSVMEASHGTAAVVPFADRLLHVQWLAAPQFRPPRIGA
ncbi:MAG: hypothetical protein Q7J60_00170 [Bradyrhizobium sp.]|uniref:hypothetical protein n=1 Tax=Bradyrhizobium sp. TaxID=376 RepID=UPI0027225F2E|nr:hypothetical protein [Bradyrhizobium sp.]MDO9560014.1 hypothetical protein [Bradyrhizobium sp.]MDP3694184.1 hypothetical protein [Bradyrhizobium sp.]